MRFKGIKKDVTWEKNSEVFENPSKTQLSDLLEFKLKFKFDSLPKKRTQKKRIGFSWMHENENALGYTQLWKWTSVRCKSVDVKRGKIAINFSLAFLLFGSNLWVFAGVLWAHVLQTNSMI